MTNVPLIIAIVTFVVAVCISVMRHPKEAALGDDLASKARLREHMVGDIRGANQYCAAYVALLGVLAAVVASDTAVLVPFLKEIELWPFGWAFGLAALSMLFVPAGYGNNAFWALRAVWYRTIICEQAVVVLTCYGIWQAYTVLVK